MPSSPSDWSPTTCDHIAPRPETLGSNAGMSAGDGRTIEPRRFCCNDIGSRARGAVGELYPPDRSCGAVEQVGDDDGLAPDIMTVNLSKLSLPHHRHGFETRQSSPRGMETAEPSPGRTRRLIRRWSCSTMLLRYLHC